MAVTMYMGKPLSGTKPSVAIDLYDSSLSNLAPSYLTHKLNEKLMLGLTNRSGSLSVIENGVVMTYDDGGKEVLIAVNENKFVTEIYDKYGQLLETVTTTVSGKDGKDIRTEVKTAGSVNGIVNFADATWDEIGVMLRRHYTGIIDLSEYWNVGDKKAVSFGAMSASGVGESHAAITQYVSIIGFNHDDLTNGGKAAITLQLTNSIGTAGYMHHSSTNVGGWADCNRRTWCNDIFYRSIEEGLRNLIKPVDKMTSNGNKNSQLRMTSDKCFLLSESEIFGDAISASFVGEGNQYVYFYNPENRKKKQSDIVTGHDIWWTRSPSSNSATQYAYTESDGDIATGDANSNYRIIPAFCI